MSLLTPMLRSSPLTDWFSDAQRVQGMLDFEAALAQAQAACGIIYVIFKQNGKPTVLQAFPT